jgi:site-specific DNA recombinase
MPASTVMTGPQLANLSGMVATLVTENLTGLEEQRQQLMVEKQVVLGRRATWQRAQERMADLEAWCRSVASQLGNLTYDQKRMALDALGVRVIVWRSDHSPRYRIEANIPLDEPIVSRTGRSSSRG